MLNMISHSNTNLITLFRDLNTLPEVETCIELIASVGLSLSLSRKKKDKGFILTSKTQTGQLPVLFDLVVLVVEVDH